MNRIPTLDIRRFSEPASAGDRDAFVAELGAAYREWGFAGIRGHGIPPALIDASYDVFQRFFALPEAVKMKYHVPAAAARAATRRSASRPRRTRKHFDLKEFWHIGREIPRDSKYADVMPPNLWPEEVPDFREQATACTSRSTSSVRAC